MTQDDDALCLLVVEKMLIKCSYKGAWQLSVAQLRAFFWLPLPHKKGHSAAPAPALPFRRPDTARPLSLLQ